MAIDGAPERIINVPSLLLTGSSEEHYVLHVVGNSMIGEGIYDGDYIVVLKRQRAESGESVVALIGDDVTIKRFHSDEDGKVQLQSLNPAIRPLYFRAGEVCIQGIAVGLMRRL